MVLKGYECFEKGDIKGLAALQHEHFVMKMNGMHSLSGTYNGWDNCVQNCLSKIPIALPNFNLIIKNSFANESQVFVYIKCTADNLEAFFGHYFVIADDKIKESHTFDDSQKVAHAMKAVV